jgi:hypothetical protein
MRNRALRARRTAAHVISVRNFGVYVGKWHAHRPERMPFMRVV